MEKGLSVRHSLYRARCLSILDGYDFGDSLPMTSPLQSSLKEIEALRKTDADFPWGCGREAENYNAALDDVLTVLQDKQT